MYSMRRSGTAGLPLGLGPMRRRRAAAPLAPLLLLALAALAALAALQGRPAFAALPMGGPTKAPAAFPASARLSPARAPRVAMGALKSPGGPLDEASTGLLLLNVVTALFGSNQAIIRTLVTDDDTAGAMDCMLCMALRFSIATLALGAAMGVNHVRGEDPAARARSALAEGEGASRAGFWELLPKATELAVWLFLGFVAQAQGLQFTTAGHGALLGSLTVVLVPFLSLTDGRKLSTATMISAGLALCGSCIFVGPEAFAGGSLGGYGDMLQLASAALFAVQLWRCEKISRTVPRDQVTELTCLQLGMVALMSLACLFGSTPDMSGVVNTMASWPMMEWGQVAVMGLVTTAFCLWAEARALQTVDAAPAALVYACEPLWGALFAWLWLGETLDGPYSTIGAAVLLLASAVGVLSSMAGSGEAAEAAEVSDEPAVAN
mmetsp:Transcript_92922/g.200935  ORF Transcript_92922/g.200935 Transcript_92922/m.200935 type:complete len:436 (-) Transcript_92922:73-1380(-)